MGATAVAVCAMGAPSLLVTSPSLILQSAQSREVHHVMSLTTTLNVPMMAEIAAEAHALVPIAA